jgi:Ice-binding-like
MIPRPSAPVATAAPALGLLNARSLPPSPVNDGETSSLAVSGDVTLDAQGNSAAVFIFQISSTLTTVGFFF